MPALTDPINQKQFATVPCRMDAIAYSTRSETQLAADLLDSQATVQ